MVLALRQENGGSSSEFKFSKSDPFSTFLELNCDLSDIGGHLNFFGYHAVLAHLVSLDGLDILDQAQDQPRVFDLMGDHRYSIALDRLPGRVKSGRLESGSKESYRFNRSGNNFNIIYYPVVGGQATKSLIEIEGIPVRVAGSLELLASHLSLIPRMNDSRQARASNVALVYLLEREKCDVTEIAKSLPNQYVRALTASLEDAENKPIVAGCSPSSSYINDLCAALKSISKPITRYLPVDRNELRLEASSSQPL